MNVILFKSTLLKMVFENIINVLIIAIICCTIQIKANDVVYVSMKNDMPVPVQQKQQQQQPNNNSYNNYAPVFPYTSLSSASSKQHNDDEHQQHQQPLQQQQLLQVNEKDDIQQHQLPKTDYSNSNHNDNYNMNHDMFNNEKQPDIEYVRPKPVMRFSDEQLNQPNAYLINSNVRENEKELPCLPCKTKNGAEEEIIYQQYQPNIELSPVNRNFINLNPLQAPQSPEHPDFNVQSLQTIRGDIPPPTDYLEQNLQNHRYPSLISQSNSVYDGVLPTTNLFLTQSEYSKTLDSDGKYANKEVTIVCHGMECSTKVKTSDNDQPISIKSEGIPSTYTSKMITNFESRILKAIINDLQYIKNLQSHFDDASLINKNNNNEHKPIIVVDDDQHKIHNIPTSSYTNTAVNA